MSRLFLLFLLMWSWLCQACLIPSVLGYLPPVKSPYCIWKCILRAVALRHTGTTVGFSSSALAGLSTTLEAAVGDGGLPQHDPKGVQAVVWDCLREAEGFAGQVATVCLYVYLGLPWPDVAQTPDSPSGIVSMLSHCRECIDTVLDAVLLSLSYSSSSDADILSDTTLIESLVVAVEEFMLGQMGGGALYEKIYAPLCLVANSLQMNVVSASDTGRITDQQWDDANRIARELEKSFTIRSKLRALVKLLQLLSAAPEHTLDSTLASSNSPEVQAHAPQEEAAMDSDTLLELLTITLQHQQQHGICNWIAQYLLLSSPLLVNHDSLSIGVEGYALVTLQQAVETLLADQEGRSGQSILHRSFPRYYSLDNENNPHTNQHNKAVT